MVDTRCYGIGQYTGFKDKNGLFVTFKKIRHDWV